MTSKNILSTINTNVPYTYLLKFKPSNMYYYGVKYNKDANPSKFFKNYFTSSKMVKDLIKLYGKDSFEFEIRCVFRSKEEALEHEQTVIRRMKLIDDPRFFNIASNTSKPSKSGFIYINDGVNNKYWDKQIPIPDGFIRGSTIKGRPKLPTITINDGENEFRLPINTPIPEGYVRGRTVATTKGRKAYTIVGTDTITYLTDEAAESRLGVDIIAGLPDTFKHVNTDSMWIHNILLGKELHIKNGDDMLQELMNNGYSMGRLPSSLASFQRAGAMSKGVLNKIWVNNGTSNLMCYRESVPEGYTLGRLTKTKRTTITKTFICPHCAKTIKGESNAHRWHFDNCVKSPTYKPTNVKKIAYHDINTKKRIYLVEGVDPPSNLVKGYA